MFMLGFLHPPLYLIAFSFGNIVSLTGLVQVFLNSASSTLTCLLLPLMPFTISAALDGWQVQSAQHSLHKEKSTDSAGSVIISLSRVAERLRNTSLPSSWQHIIA